MIIIEIPSFLRRSKMILVGWKLVKLSQYLIFLHYLWLLAFLRQLNQFLQEFNCLNLRFFHSPCLFLLRPYLFLPLFVLLHSGSSLSFNFCLCIDIFFLLPRILRVWFLRIIFIILIILFFSFLFLSFYSFLFFSLNLFFSYLSLLSIFFNSNT